MVSSGTAVPGLFVMDDYLPDALIVIGFGLVVAGAALLFGYEWALLIAGMLLLIAGAAAAWRQAR
jgi:hypothetical protein